MQLPTDLVSLLVYLAGGLAAYVLAPLLEKWPSFVALPTQAKVIIVAATNTALAIAAIAIQQFVPKETITELNPFFAVGLNAIYLAINQVSYALQKAKPTASE